MSSNQRTLLDERAEASKSLRTGYTHAGYTDVAEMNSFHMTGHGQDDTDLNRTLDHD
jgi:hypothetical protein